MTETLLDVLNRRFTADIDPDSDAGQILGCLNPEPPFDDSKLTGKAKVASLTFAPTAGGISVRAAKAQDALVFTVPEGPFNFTIDATPAPVVHVELVGLDVPLPFLRAAQLVGDALQLLPGEKVQLHFPALELVVPSATAPHLAPTHAQGGGVDVTMTPPFVLVGPDTVLGFGFEKVNINLDAPSGPQLTLPTVEIYIAPPGVPALGGHGGGGDITIGLGSGGVSGDFDFQLNRGAAATRPSWLSQVAGHLRLNNNSVTLLALHDQIDMQSAIEQHLGGALNDPGPEKIDVDLSLVLDNGWQATLALSGTGGRNYLWRTQSANGGNVLRDTLGAYAVFGPLLAPNLPDPGSSGYVDLALTAGLAGLITAAKVARTQAVTLYGGQLVVHQPAGQPAEGFLFFDLETLLDLDIELGGNPLIKTRRPIAVRHRSIGLRLDLSANAIKPVFDPSQGFNLDLSDPGMFEVAPPLSDILQPDGTRMARQNPLILEVDLVLKADLGVVKIDRATVRAPVDGQGDPTLTALGVHLNIPGALEGNGYLKLAGDGGFEGSLDVSVVPLLTRAAAQLVLQHLDSGDTAVLATLDLELPIPIVLGASGLGLYGFLGLFGMHFTRNQAAGESPLKWLIDAGGDATKIAAWKPEVHQWALGLGAVIGTVEGGFLAHAKGMVVVEVPGPRLLLVMNADILSTRPDRRGTDMGQFTAVIDIESDSVTIGIILTENLAPLLEVIVPTEIYFNYNDPADWHLDVGGIPPAVPASIKFLSYVRADGYFLISGEDIDNFPPHPLPGFAVAAGVSADLHWGPEEIGLYIRVAVRVDVGISFNPFLVLGQLRLDGELHLFIVSIGVSAQADTKITRDSFWIRADVCGEVDFFFFSVKGCVSLQLGTEPDLPPAPPLLRAVSLHSRSPALLPGTGTDRPIDGSLGEAALLDKNGQPAAPLPVVPIDAIPGLQFEMAPYLDPSCQPLGNTSLESKLPANDWARRGERFYRYTLKSVTVTSSDPNGPFDAGETPVSWWDRHSKQSLGDDNDVQLALLTWSVDPTAAAAERSVQLDERVKRRWGTICTPVARPASLLWVWRPAPLGPAANGWTIHGTAWPDDPGAYRSTPPDDRLLVIEPWRSNNTLADGLSRVNPAFVYGQPPNFTDRVLVAPNTGKIIRPAVDSPRVAALLGALRPAAVDGLVDAIRFGDGLSDIQALIFVRRDLLDTGVLHLRALNAGGESVGPGLRIDPASARVVNALKDLPPRWQDPAGPWLALVEPVVTTWFQSYRDRAHFESFVLVLVETTLPDSTVWVEIGLETDVGIAPPHWGSLIIEAGTGAEILRSKFDEQSRQEQVKQVNGALGADDGKRALLRPKATYTVTVTYDVETADADDSGKPKPTGKSEQGEQSFQFQTDDKPPNRLDPWVLTTDPGSDEGFFFWGDPLRVVFVHGAVRKLFGAYETRELSAVVRAASGKHPPAVPGFDPSNVKLSQTVTGIQTAPLTVMTPYEASLRTAVAGRDCIDTSQGQDRHEKITLKLKLNPSTNYVLDIVADPPADDGVHPLFRRNFSTSRYESAAALAAAVAGNGVQHRRVSNATPLLQCGSGLPTSAPVQVADMDLEAALRAVRWGDLARPSTPRTTVIWLDGASGSPPQPIAVLIETPEPLWRWRDTPQGVTDAGTQRYIMGPTVWLDVIETPDATPLVIRFVSSAGGGRTLVVLAPNARGAVLKLALRRTNSPLIEGDKAVETVQLIAASLTAAPWEDCHE
jgi:hypothetical protein